MMINAAGLVERFSVPLPELESGSHAVNWRASGEGGSRHQGTIHSTIR